MKWQCKKHFAGVFQDARTTCPFCHAKAATMTSVSNGLSYEDMAKMYNCFDLYIGCNSCKNAEFY